MLEVSYEELAQEEKELLDAAQAALVHAYNPYNSQMKVAAAVRTSSGEIVSGASYVNNSSPSSICAERSTIVTANSTGHRDLRMMAVIGIKEGGVKNPVTPCGNCRQVMQEVVNISGEDLIVICSNSDKTRIIKTSLEELLPLPYGGSRKNVV
jgi:cytidine deaminase